MTNSVRLLIYSTLFSVCFASYSFASNSTAPLPEGTRVGLYVEDLTSGEVLEKSNDEVYFPPASTLKLVTALAAKLELGNDFHYQTQLSQVGQDLVFHFSGDPTLSSEHLKSMLEQAKKQGLEHIRGDIWLDVDAFSGYDRAVGSPWDILGVCYSAPASSAIIDGNCIESSIYTQDNGKTRVFVPKHYPIQVTTKAITVTKAGQESAQCDLELLPTQENHYQLQGCLVERNKPLPLRFAVQNPNLYASQVIYAQLRQLGIQLDGQIKIGKAPGRRIETLVIHQSENLDQLLDSMLKNSDNLIADSLTKTIGAHFYIQSGSFTNGTEAIKQVLFARAGIDLENVPMADGSGLSRNNRMTVKMMSNVLRYIWQNDQSLNLISHMPIAGVDGTLKYRSSMRRAPVQSNIVAKSGSLYGSHNMAGFALDSFGKPKTMFVQYVTDYYPQPTQSATQTPLALFEQQLYERIINASQATAKK
ncbi:D-alanyl-D-alanine carboxypeptidase / D-alanyl-D-alanine-endopeptidase (penicillin-binding protein 4) [Vibrio xiamenensis]|uniref:D-alanyl-D-alanine carboxypeptidase / D-alanyl-D-alanine-endopeptidase (Penicillin-binding protein 4) n=1 Tax=Vibrio xiamenensis TaxID=861298 RepID=A0A1G8AY61_9VIBR|nr:serine-type D-Ala-D-Ala carboxypeptidase [Vibrio xiamenensis]SDH25929.1 D-alanyl-D-alanine carboxypeptidase / D-alanyl-D-alanine-endopeptidase (penicillin-binding protein 4) [Vibrio xiamenensis]